jgi:hypothetical protein
MNDANINGWMCLSGAADTWLKNQNHQPSCKEKGSHEEQDIKKGFLMKDGVKQANESKISDWLDKKEKEKFDVSRIVLPDDLPYDEVPDETIFFKEINPDGILSIANHPFSTVERFGHWYYCRGRDKATGTHSSGKEWRLFTKDKDLALKTAESHLE